MNRDLLLISLVVAMSVAAFLIGSAQFVLGVVVVLSALAMVTLAQMFEHRVNSRAWERSSSEDYDEGEA